MDTKALKVIFVKKSTKDLIEGVTANRFSAEEKEVALQILKNRGQKIDELFPKNTTTDGEIESEAPAEVQEGCNKISDARVKEVSACVDKICELGGEAALAAGDILGEKEIEDLTDEEADKLMALIPEGTQLEVEEEEAPKVERKEKDKKSKKAPSISSNVPQGKIDEILALDCNKKEKVIKLFEVGLSKSEIVKLKFMSAVYIHKLYHKLYPGKP